VKAVIHVPLDGTVPHPNGRSEPLHAGGDVTEPFAIVSVLPDCRALAGAPIPVAVELVVTREGTVQSARILSAVPDSAKALVLESVRGWRFRPATFNGRAVAVTWTVAMKCA
jgi:TonB family protein